MDNSNDNQHQSISDDQELAKALAGVNQEANGLSFEETEANSPNGPTPLGGASEPDYTHDQAAPEPTNQVGFGTPAVDPITPPSTPIQQPTSDSGLASVKEAALLELRPLIDKLDVDPEEKFNTYLLLIRSTDDKDLIAPAHEAAKSITDEAKKAQALLDIIKEIDFLSNTK